MPKSPRPPRRGPARPADRSDRPTRDGQRPAAARPKARLARPERPERPARPARTPSEALAPAPDKAERITKLLARAGVASRRDIEKMILEGRIKYKGEVIKQPAPLLRTLDDITVDGHPVSAAKATRLFLFHKPAGCLTTARDPKGRPTIFDLLPKDLPRLLTVGRLDMNTEGLLLLTNDGA